MHIPLTVIARHRVRGGIASFCLAAALLAAPAAQAIPFTTDLSISGSVGFDGVYAAGLLSGTGSQDGSFRAILGGATTSSTFNGSTVTGANPLNGTLTALGDGFGFTGSASANGIGTYGIGIDVGLNLSNTSATDTYKINFNIAFENRVDSSGTDAYAHSEFYVRDPNGGPDLFFTDLWSDTVNGNAKGGQPVAGFGGLVTETGPASFAITLLAGQSVVFDPTVYDLSWTLEGGAYTIDGASSAFLDAFLSIASVEKVTTPPNPNPNPAPEPATLALLGIGLAGLGALRRRGAHI